MKTTAEKFRKHPYRVYEAAANGEKVTINHDRHKDCVFELTSRKRQPLSEIEDDREICAD